MAKYNQRTLVFHVVNVIRDLVFKFSLVNRADMQKYYLTDIKYGNTEIGYFYKVNVHTMQVDF